MASILALNRSNES